MARDSSPVVVISGTHPIWHVFVEEDWATLRHSRRFANLEAAYSYAIGLSLGLTTGLDDRSITAPERKDLTAVCPVRSPEPFTSCQRMPA